MTALVLTLLAPLHSQVNLEATPHFATGSGPRNVAVADLNGDGNLDIVTSNSLDNTVSVLLGNGDGTFRPATSYAVPGNANFVAIGDFNNDGKPDLAVATQGGVGAPKQIVVLIGNGDGTFQAPVGWPTSDSPFAVALGDFNGDGKLDIAVTDFSGGLDILLGNGDGTFSPPTTIPTGPYATFLCTGDFNKDGHLDLAVINNNNLDVTVFLGNGSGSFSPAFTYSSTQKILGIATADLNLDGNGDLALTRSSLTGQTQQALTVLLGNGNGSFSAAADYGSAVEPFAPAVADFNGDGIPDLAVTDQASNTVHILLGKGDGTLQPWADYATGLAAEGIAVGDFTGSGNSDIATANYGSNDVSVLIRTGPGTFRGARSFALGTVSTFPPSIALGDFDGDGNLDIASGQTGMLLLLGFGDGTFGPPIGLGASGGATTGGIVAADFNSDGKLDLAAPTNVNSGLSNQLVAVLLGNGNASFQPEIDFSSWFIGPEYLGTADFNGDSKPDLFVTGPGGASVASGDGAGNFSPVRVITGTAFYAPVIADFNGDGHADVVLSDGTNLTLLTGVGDGTFHASTLPFTLTSAVSLAAGDLNGDGIPDLVAVNSVPNGWISVLLGNGDGTFRTPVTYAVGDNPQALAVADLNQDGRPDVVVALRSGAVVILLGNGDGTLQSPIVFGSVFPAGTNGGADVAIAVGDVNGDGLPDVLVEENVSTGAFISGTVTVLLNQTGLVLAPTMVSLTSSLNPAAAGEAVTLTATVAPAGGSGAPTGSVTFLNGSQTLGSSTLAGGVASLTTATLATGTDNLTASYSGDAFFAKSSSPVLPQTINATPFTVTPSTSSTVTIQAGQPAQFTLTLTPGTAQNQTISFTCSSVPPQSTCGISPNPVALSGTNTASTTVTIQTRGPGGSLSANVNSNLLRAHGLGFVWPTTLGFAFACIVIFNSRKRLHLLLLLCVFLPACGGGNSSANLGTPSNTYTIVVTGQSGSSTQTIDLTLIVQ